MTEERFWLLAGLRLSVEATPEELEELDLYMQEHSEMKLRFATLEAARLSEPPSNHNDKEAAFNKHMQRLSNLLSGSVLQYESAEETEVTFRKKKGLVHMSLYKKLVRITAIAASFLLIWFIFWNKREKQENKSNVQNTISTRKGSKSKIQLPDGTQVWLNADSKLTYNEKFRGKLREVQLSGEAFFEVVRDEERPFVIHTNAIDIKVLGTAFNVRSYADERNTETSLLHGSVEITLHSHPEKKFILKPNDKLIVPNEAADVATKKTVSEKLPPQPIQLIWGKINYPKNDSIATEALWIKNKLVFDKEPLEEIARKIERWYNVKVNITDESLKSVEYSGVFEDESLQQVMSALHDAGLNYKINKKEVIIRP